MGRERNDRRDEKIRGDERKKEGNGERGRHMGEIEEEEKLNRRESGEGKVGREKGR